MIPRLHAFGGVDPAGLAGLAADIRCAQAMGVHLCPVPTANTVQSEAMVGFVKPVSDELFIAQLEALNRPGGPLSPSAFKVGLLPTVAQVNRVAELVRQATLPTVVDPVGHSSSGTALAESEAFAALGQLAAPHVCITPNQDEAYRLTGIRPTDAASTRQAAAALRTRGFGAVVIKGGHGEGGFASDFFVDQHRSFWLHSRRRPIVGARGTGCSFATALASSLARGYDASNAVVLAKMAVNQGLRKAYPIGTAHHGLRITEWPKLRADMPFMSPLDVIPPDLMPPDGAWPGESFPDCGPTPLGLYPVVDRVHWIERLIGLGVSTVQLRIKDLEGAALVAQVEASIALCRTANTRLFVNDHWKLAIELGAYGVHLGQSDLDGADRGALLAAGLRLGVSSHCHYEVARALAWRPSYIACGPVFATETKVMPWCPQGLDGLAYWRALVGEGLVAIGGINLERARQVVALGVKSVAMITAITEAPEPDAAARDLLAVVESPPDEDLAAR